jgi:hypothetical protein
LEGNFVDEWAGLGSYDSWRAIMSAFLHPENMLLPTLRRDRTGAFRRLVATLQAPGGVTPGAARQAAATFFADLDADTSTDINADLGRDRLVAHWPLNGGQGTSVADITGDTKWVIVDCARQRPGIELQLLR